MIENESRRRLLKGALAGVAGLGLLPHSQGVFAQQTKHGILGQAAPELQVKQWIDGSGNSQAPFSVNANKGKWIYLKCFQDWCPACHSAGFPNLQKLMAAFPDNDNLVAAVIQTTFEGYSFNTFNALRKNQVRYDLSVPFGHDPGNPDAARGTRARYPATMVDYRTGGTPWVTLINPEGQVVYDNFHINIDELIAYFKRTIV